jgi:hypothetical protein
METEIKLIKAELERLRHHYDLSQKYREEDKSILIDIKNTLVGSVMNDNKGVVHLIKDIDARVKHLEAEHHELNVYKTQMKYVIGLAVAGMFTLMISIYVQSRKNSNDINRDSQKIDLMYRKEDIESPFDKRTR